MKTLLLQFFASQLAIFFLTIIFPLYTLFILWRNEWKVLHSISDSWYILKQRGKGEEILFTLFCYILGFGLVLQYPYSVTFFFGGMGMFWVGTYTQFRDVVTIKGTIHYLGAVLGIVLTLVGLSLNGIWLPIFIWVLGTSLMKLLKVKNFIWWVEILAFLVIIFGLYKL